MKLIDLNNITDNFTKADVYIIVKTRLGIIGSGVAEDIVEAVDEAALMICNYCCRRKVPQPLMYVLCEMAIDIINNYGARGTAGSSSSTSASIEGSTIKVGRVEVTKSASSSTGSKSNEFQYLINMKDIIAQYTDQLDSYRCLWWC